MEYYYCYSIEKKLFKTEKEYAKELGLYIIYNEKEDTFYDAFNKKIDIKGINLFPRTGILQTKTLINAINRHQGISILNERDYEKTLNWPYYIKTIRNNIILSGNQILDNPNCISDIFGTDKVFFKTKFKNFSQIIEISNFFEKDSSFMKTIKAHCNDEFIISDAVFIEKDSYGPLEYRAFIINGNIFNISRISDTLLCSIPKEIINKLEEIVTNLKETDFPTSYVIDLFIYKDKKGNKEIDVLECNPIIASGTYLYNSVLEKIEDIEHKCPSISIPKEKIKYDNHQNYSFNAINNSTPSIFYKTPGGFAADLISFSIFDKKSSENYFFHSSSNNINVLNFSTLENDMLLTDDDLKDKENKSKKLLRIKEDK